MMSLVNLETWFRTSLKCSLRSTVLSDVRTGSEPPNVKLRLQQLSLLRCSFSHNRLFTVIILVCKACFAWSVLGRSSKWWLSWDVLLTCRLHLLNKLCNILFVLTQPVPLFALDKAKYLRWFFMLDQHVIIRSYFRADNNNNNNNNNQLYLTRVTRDSTSTE